MSIHHALQKQTREKQKKSRRRIVDSIFLVLCAIFLIEKWNLLSNAFIEKK